MNKSKYSYSISGETLFEFAESHLQKLEVPKEDMEEATKHVLSATLNAIDEEIYELVGHYARRFVDDRYSSGIRLVDKKE
ncbi:hypothetical protein [Anaerolinea sp.]|uniref:hypothetical protein n=1 Tax=Anaerolinea sp. TaxID=1872519 RepID=UPI002ACDAD17|nr:hypothetical protein [Anaerolinea sp.]